MSAFVLLVLHRTYIDVAGVDVVGTLDSPNWLQEDSS